jgi:hypothetical protein
VETSAGSEVMKLFAATFYAEKTTDQGAVFKIDINTATVFGEDEEQADIDAYTYCRKHFPRSEGYNKWGTNISEIKMETYTVNGKKIKLLLEEVDLDEQGER